MWPLMEVSVEPNPKTDAEKLVNALDKLAFQDPTFTFLVDQVAGRTIMKGTGEEHLNIKVDLLRRVYDVDINVGRLQVAYRECLGRSAEILNTYKRQTGGSSQFAQVRIVFEPGEAASGFHFESKVPFAIPGEFILGVKSGLEQQREIGLLVGFPVIDFKATLIEGRYHDVDSSALAFEVAARAAFCELREKGSPNLLEPIMKVEVLTPPRYAAAVIEDFEGRRGDIEGAWADGNVQVVSALVPLASMIGYADILRAVSQGEAQFTMRFERYQAAQLPEPPDDLFPPAVGMRA